MSPSPMNRSFTSPAASSRSTPRNIQPSTPTVVPPTPTPLAGPSSAKIPSPSPASSFNDLFYEPAEDTERQNNRRSMYRSPGTSSSPDLATLLRKAKERGGVVGAHHKEKRRESPPPLPSGYDRPTTGNRQRSSTSVSPNPMTNASPQTTPLPRVKTRTNRGQLGQDSPDWILTSPRDTKVNGSSKVSGPISFMGPLADVILASQKLCASQNQCVLREDAWTGNCTRTISKMLKAVLLYLILMLYS